MAIFMEIPDTRGNLHFVNIESIAQLVEGRNDTETMIYFNAAKSDTAVGFLSPTKYETLKLEIARLLARQ